MATSWDSYHRLDICNLRRPPLSLRLLKQLDLVEFFDLQTKPLHKHAVRTLAPTNKRAPAHHTHLHDVIAALICNGLGHRHCVGVEVTR